MESRYYRFALDQAAIVAMTDHRGKISYVNDNFTKISGYSAEEIIGRPFRILRSSHHPREFFKEFWSTIRGGSIWHGEILNRAKNGELYWIMTTVIPIVEADQTPQQYISISYDITHKKRAEEELLQQSNFVLKITETMPSILHIYSAQMDRTLYVNERVFDILGYTADEIYRLESSFLGKIHEQDISRYKEHIHNLCISRSSMVAEIEYRMQHKSGEWIELHESTSCFKMNEKGNTQEYISIIEDVTEKNKALRVYEKQRSQIFYSSKMASLGELAGGVAHEINNPLAIIHGLARQLRGNVQAGALDAQKIVNSAEKIEKTAERISKIIKGLRTFARDGSNDPFTSAKLKQIISDALSFCETRLRNHGVHIEVSSFSDNLTLKCRSVQIAQVLVNLLNNASDAVMKVDHPRIRLEVEELPSFVVIRVVDNGPGIPADIADRILEPFFTTKGPDIGTGLGLSISHSIVLSHGGSIQLDTQAPNTTFVITLPRDPQGILEKAA